MKEEFTHRFRGADLTLARRIRSVGVPIHIGEDDVGERAGPADDLLIRQTGHFIWSTLFDFYGATGVVIQLVITVKRPQFAIADFGLELPWPGPIQWLEPFGSDGMYRFEARRGSPHEYPGSDVLNHHRNVRHMYKGGESLDGYLLGINQSSIPTEFSHGTRVPAFVIVWDQFHRSYRSPVSLWVDRHSGFVLSPVNRRRRRLHDCPDPGFSHVRIAEDVSAIERKV